MSNYRIFPIGEPDREIHTNPCHIGGYRINSYQKIHLIPTLEEVLSDADVGPFNKGNFVQYLASSHCLENYEFIVSMNQYMEQKEERERWWRYIMTTFLVDDALKEINLPCKVRVGLLRGEGELPSEYMVGRARLIVYDMLLESYNDFIRAVKLQPSTECFRRKSDSVAPSPSPVPGLPVPWTPELAGMAAARGPGTHNDVFSPLSSPHIAGYGDEKTPETMASDHCDARNNSNSSGGGSRGSSIGLLMDSFKNRDLVNWRKTAKKLRIRRSLNEI